MMLWSLDVLVSRRTLLLLSVAADNIDVRHPALTEELSCELSSPSIPYPESGSSMLSADNTVTLLMKNGNLTSEGLTERVLQRGFLMKKRYLRSTATRAGRRESVMKKIDEKKVSTGRELWFAHVIRAKYYCNCLRPTAAAAEPQIRTQTFPLMRYRVRVL